MKQTIQSNLEHWGSKITKKLQQTLLKISGRISILPERLKFLPLIGRKIDRFSFFVPKNGSFYDSRTNFNRLKVEIQAVLAEPKVGRNFYRKG